MPIYEFECNACSRVSEHIMKMSDNNPEVCPHCQAEKSLSKLMSRSSFVLKGQGWYETDFKNSPKSSEQKASENTDSPTPKKASSKEASSKDSSSKTSGESKSSSSGAKK